MPMANRAAAEFIGTFWLVLGGCGSAVLAAAFPHVGIGLLGVAFAFGLTVLTMAFAIGHISGCHLNPAVSIGLYAGGRFPASDLIPYVIAQVAGAIAGAGILYLIASGKAGFPLADGLASNGYGEHSPGGYSLASVIVTEIVMTFMFLIIILGATDKRAPIGFRTDSNRTGIDAHSPDQHSGEQYLGEPCTQHGPRSLRRRLGAVAALGVLGGADRRSRPGRRGLPSGGPRRCARALTEALGSPDGAGSRHI